MLRWICWTSKLGKSIESYCIVPHWQFFSFIWINMPFSFRYSLITKLLNPALLAIKTWKYTTKRERERERAIKFRGVWVILIIGYHILSSIVCTFYIEHYAKIFPVHYTWTVAEKGFKMAFMMNKHAMIISCEIILEK